MSEESLKRRVQGSLKAVELSQLLENSEIEDADFMDGLIDRLQRDFGRDEVADVTDVKPPPINRLGNTKIDFGGHKGKTFDEIPLAYLDWLCRSQECFYRDLRAYLKHPELEARRGGV